jgi:hypothetical protein
MNSEIINKLNTLASKTPSKWVEKAKHRQKYRWYYNIKYSRPIIFILVRYYRLKRKLENDKIKFLCIYCGRYFTKPNFIKSHGEKCNAKRIGN